MAFVVVVHLDPDRESRMAELLQDRTGIPVTQVTGATTLEADHICMIPPTHDLAMCGLMLTLRERGERSAHAPVDLLFRTLADSSGQDAGAHLPGWLCGGRERARRRHDVPCMAAGYIMSAGELLRRRR